jgi:hypothetical protein
MVNGLTPFGLPTNVVLSVVVIAAVSDIESDVVFMRPFSIFVVVGGLSLFARLTLGRREGSYA